MVDLDGDLIMAFDSKKPHEGDQGVCHRNPEGTKPLTGLTKDPIKKDLTGGIYKASKRVCVFFCNGWWLEVVFSGGVP